MKKYIEIIATFLFIVSLACIFGAALTVGAWLGQ